MPGRTIPLVTDEIYHVFNRGVARQLTYRNRRDYLRFIELMNYYVNVDVTPRYSKFIMLPFLERTQILSDLAKKKNFLVEIISFCLMPNHFHMIIKQTREGGVTQFLQNVANSYVRYFDTKYHREGPLYQGRFKSIHIESDEQLLHVVRYVHLNPYTSYIVKDLEKLLLYQYSSLPVFLNTQTNPFISLQQIRSYFKRVDDFKQFTLDQGDYQRKLSDIRHVCLDI